MKKQERMIGLLFDMALFALALTLERFMGWNRLTRMLRREKVGLEHKLFVFGGDINLQKFNPNRRGNINIDEIWEKYKTTVSKDETK